MASEQSADPNVEYLGPEADEKARRINAALGTDAVTLVDGFWLLRYTTAKYNLRQILGDAE